MATTEEQIRPSSNVTPKLKFTIPAALQARLLKAKSNSTRTTYWSHTWYKDVHNHPVRVFYSNNLEHSEELARRFLSERVIGFDMEWKFDVKNKGKVYTGIKDNISLIQLARDGEVALFHIARHAGEDVPSLFAPSLLKIITSPTITKTGVAIHNADASRLRKFANITARGLFELSHLYRLLKYAETQPQEVTRGVKSLTEQVEAHLGFPLFKGPVRTSDWTQHLTEQHRSYAAGDAYAGLILYHTMNPKRLTMDPIPPIPAFSELYLPILLGEKKVAGIRQQENPPDHTDGPLETTVPSAESSPGFEPVTEHLPEVEPLMMETRNPRRTPAPETVDIIQQKGDDYTKRPRTSREAVPDGAETEMPPWFSSLKVFDSFSSGTSGTDSKDTGEFARDHSRKNKILPNTIEQRMPHKRRLEAENTIPPHPPFHPEARHTASGRQIPQGATPMVPRQPAKISPAVPEAPKSLFLSLHSLYRRLSQDPSLYFPDSITIDTVKKLAEAKPSSIGEVYKIPGGAAFLMYCKKVNVDLLVFVRTGWFDFE